MLRKTNKNPKNPHKNKPYIFVNYLFKHSNNTYLDYLSHNEIEHKPNKLYNYKKLVVRNCLVFNYYQTLF